MSDAPDSVEVAAEPTPSPFALTEDHEFSAPTPAPSPETHSIGVDLASGSDIAVETVVAPPPAHPGTPESDYRRCPCISVMPGRACPRCNCSKWVKTCPKCKGEMFLTVHSRKGAHARTERCGFCMGLGQVAARVEEVRAAEETAKAYKPTARQERQVYERGPQLPGVRQSKPKATTFAERAKSKAAGLKRRARG
jgi:hypothetical protein